MFKIINCCILSPIHGGIGPENIFSPTSNMIRLLQFFKVESNSPIRLLFRKTNTSNFTRLPMDTGILPDNLLLLKSRHINRSTDFQQSGSCPFNWLYDKSKMVISEVLGSHMNENKSENLLLESLSSKACSKNQGILPSKWFELRIIDGLLRSFNDVLGIVPVILFWEISNHPILCKLFQNHFGM